MKVNNSPWNILGLEPGSTQTEIKQAFRRLAMDHHPDKGGCNQTFAQINRAYNELKEKKHIPVLTQPDTILVNVYLSIRQQIEGVNDYIVCRKPNSKEDITISAKIPRGARSGDKFKIIHQGKNYILNIKEKADEVFTREGFGVIMKYDLNIITAMRGGNISVTDPCGIEHNVKINPGTTSDVLVIQERGLYNRKKRTHGNMYIYVTAKIPAITDDKLDDFIQQLKA